MGKWSGYSEWKASEQRQTVGILVYEMVIVKWRGGGYK